MTREPAASRDGQDERWGRAICIGLGCALAICAFGYFHDTALNKGARLIPHLMPPVVYGGLIVAVLFANPLLRRWRPGSQFSARELAMITALSLAACAVPFFGMVHCWPTAVMLPHHYNRLSPGWQREHILALAPERLLADISADEDQALTGYTTGLGKGDEYISPADVPWAAWRRPMLFWVPLVLCITLALVGLAVVLHYQWARNEHLPYPISAFAYSLLPDGAGGPPLLKSRLFRYAALAVFGIHMINYLHAWWPDIFIPVRLRLDFGALAKLLPTLAAGDPSRLLFQPRVMFSVIGIGFFFTTDVSFSLALGPFLVCCVLGFLAGHGISMYGGINYLYESTNAFLYLGGYFGIFIAMIYTGRHFYLTVLQRSLGLQTHDQPPPATVWCMRVFLLGMALFCALLVAVGLDWVLAIPYAAIAVMVFVVVSRAIAETGGFYVGTWIMPAAALLGFMGAQALGPRSVVIMAMVGVVVMVGPGWAPMPFAIQSIALADRAGIGLGRIAKWVAVALVLGLAVALPVTLYLQYNNGALAASGWAQYTARLPFDVGLDVTQRLQAQGMLEAAEQVHGWRRFANLSPNGPLVAGFLITAVLALAVSLCRLRFPWWPLHPIIFYFLHSHQIQRLAFSFFLAWLIRAGISRCGGVSVYQKLKPAMVGLIAGEVTAAFMPIVVGIVYTLVTGKQPVAFSVFLL